MTSRQYPFSMTVAVVQLLFGAVVAIMLGFVFRETTHDYMQHDSDAAYFFDTASSGEFSIPLDESILVTENSLPISLWSSIYASVSQLGLQPTPIWGILLNALLVFASQLLTLTFARGTFGYDERRLNGLAALLALNGVLMMFAGIHMRDAFLLFTTTVSMVAFVPRPSATTQFRLLQFGLLLLLMGVAFLCRTEGPAVPLMIYVVSLAIAMNQRSALLKIAAVGVATALVGLAVASGALELAMHNYEAYRLLAQDESSDGSFAYFLLYKLPFPLSVIASAVLVLFIKFPFWRDGLYDSYAFFISMAALQMLFVAPAFIALLAHALFNKVRSEIRYLLLVQLGLLLMTALTSNQVRHFAVGYPFLLLLFHMRTRVYGSRSSYATLQHVIFGSALILNLVMVLR